jgi:hypothetical protein
MKSMSMVSQGNSTLAWVCRCSNGLRSASSPDIHILAGEKVCIQAITPTQFSSALASTITRRIASGSVSTCCHCTGSGNLSSSVAAMLRDCSATWRSVASP